MTRYTRAAILQQTAQGCGGCRAVFRVKDEHFALCPDCGGMLFFLDLPAALALVDATDRELADGMPREGDVRIPAGADWPPV